MKINQIEMPLPVGTVRCRSRKPLAVRPARARWWFEQMRQVVEQTQPPEETFRVPEADMVNPEG